MVMRGKSLVQRFPALLARSVRFAPEPSSLLISRAAVAVSGGRDSLALCFVLDRWLRGARLNDSSGFSFSTSSPPLLALTVDHELRGEESAKEARLVGAWMAKRGIEHRILSPSNPPAIMKEFDYGKDKAVAIGVSREHCS